MGFGAKFVAGAEQDKLKALQKTVNEQSQDSDGPEKPVSASPASSSQQPASAPSAPARRPWQRGASPQAQPQNETPTAPARASFQAPSGPVSESDRQERLVAKAKRCVQDLGEYKGWSQAEIALKERQCQSEPQKVIDELIPLVEEIAARRKTGERSLEDAMKKNPDHVVFMLLKGESQKLRSIPPSEAGAQALLHGSVVESVPARQTLFDEPSVLFATPSPAEEPAPVSASAPKI